MPQFVPVIELEIVPNSAGAGDKLVPILSELAADDAHFCFKRDGATGRALLAGIDEQQLDRKIDVIRQQYGTEFTIGPPQIAYRETISRPATVDYTHKRLKSGEGEFARVTLMVEPIDPVVGNRCVIGSNDGAVPGEYAAAVEKGINAGLGSGVFAAFPVIGVSATFIDGAYHDTDSSMLAFEIAARAALREALQKGESILLEPVMHIEITTLEPYVDRIVRDLASRRGRIEKPKVGTSGVIYGVVPAANLFGYANSLRSMSDDRATYVSRFDHYVRVPESDDPGFRPAIGMRA